MKKVQLVEVYCDPEGYTDDYGYSRNTKYSYSSETQWEDISDDDFDILLKAVEHHNKEESEYRYVILIFSEKRPEPVIADYLNKIQEYQEKEERKKKELEAKKKKQQEEAKASEKQKKLKLFEQLQKELDL